MFLYVESDVYNFKRTENEQGYVHVPRILNMQAIYWKNVMFCVFAGTNFFVVGDNAFSTVFWF